MKRNHLLVLAAAAILAMFFVPRAAYSMELAVPSLPSVPAIPTLPTPACPLIPAVPDWRTPKVPTFPSRDIRFPVIPVELPSRGIPGPSLPVPVIVERAPRQKPVLAMARGLAAAAPSAAVQSAKLDKAFDNAPRASASVSSDDAVVIVPQRKPRRKGDPSHLTLPESDLESEIGIR